MVKPKKDKNTEDTILAAAKKVFVKHGMAGARMQDIADEAGINKALLHYYFKSKDHLFDMIFMEEAKKFFPKLNMIFEAEMPLFEKIERFADEYITEILENPYLPWFVINELNRDPDRFLFNRWGESNLPQPKKFLMQVEQNIKDGVIIPISPIHLLMNLISMCLFPFIGKPMLQRRMNMSDKQFIFLMEERKKEIPRFIINAIKK